MGAWCWFRAWLPRSRGWVLLCSAPQVHLLQAYAPLSDVTYRSLHVFVCITCSADGERREQAWSAFRQEVREEPVASSDAAWSESAVATEGSESAREKACFAVDWGQQERQTADADAAALPLASSTDAANGGGSGSAGNIGGIDDSLRALLSA